MSNASRGERPKVWIIIGASRGIGFEFVRQLIPRTARGDLVFAVIRDPMNASHLWQLASTAQMARCQLMECDISSEASITVTAKPRLHQSVLLPSDASQTFARDMASRKEIDRIDYLILNAGVSIYPNVGYGLLVKADLMSI